MPYPSDLKYTKDHEWVRLSGDTAEVGITDRLQHFALLGMVNHTATWLKPGGRLSAQQIADGYCDLILK